MTHGNDHGDPRNHRKHAADDAENDEHRWMGPEENPASDPETDAEGARWMGPEENPASGGGAQALP